MNVDITSNTVPDRSPDLIFRQFMNGIFFPFNESAEWQVVLFKYLTTPFIPLVPPLPNVIPTFEQLEGATKESPVIFSPYLNEPVAPVAYDVSFLELPYNKVVEFVYRNFGEMPHPIHHHGNSFYIVATSDYPNAEEGYIRRDIATVPVCRESDSAACTEPGAYSYKLLSLLVQQLLY